MRRTNLAVLYLALFIGGCSSKEAGEKEKASASPHLSPDVAIPHEHWTFKILSLNEGKKEVVSVKRIVRRQTGDGVSYDVTFELLEAIDLEKFPDAAKLKHLTFKFYDQDNVHLHSVSGHLEGELTFERGNAFRLSVVLPSHIHEKAKKVVAGF